MGEKDLSKRRSVSVGKSSKDDDDVLIMTNTQESGVSLRGGDEGGDCKMDDDDEQDRENREKIENNIQRTKSDFLFLKNSEISSFQPQSPSLEDDKFNQDVGGWHSFTNSDYVVHSRGRLDAVLEAESGTVAEGEDVYMAPEPEAKPNILIDSQDNIKTWQSSADVSNQSPASGLEALAAVAYLVEDKWSRTSTTGEDKKSSTRKVTNPSSNSFSSRSNNPVRFHPHLSDLNPESLDQDAIYLLQHRSNPFRNQLGQENTASPNLEHLQHRSSRKNDPLFHTRQQDHCQVNHSAGVEPSHPQPERNPSYNCPDPESVPHVERGEVKFKAANRTEQKELLSEGYFCSNNQFGSDSNRSLNLGLGGISILTTSGESDAHNAKLHLDQHQLYANNKTRNLGINTLDNPLILSTSILDIKSLPVLEYILKGGGGDQIFYSSSEPTEREESRRYETDRASFVPVEFLRGPKTPTQSHQDSSSSSLPLRQPSSSLDSPASRATPRHHTYIIDSIFKDLPAGAWPQRDPVGESIVIEQKVAATLENLSGSVSFSARSTHSNNNNNNTQPSQLLGESGGGRRDSEDFVETGIKEPHGNSSSDEHTLGGITSGNNTFETITFSIPQTDSFSTDQVYKHTRILPLSLSYPSRTIKRSAPSPIPILPSTPHSARHTPYPSLISASPTPRKVAALKLVSPPSPIPSTSFGSISRRLSNMSATSAERMIPPGTPPHLSSTSRLTSPSSSLSMSKRRKAPEWPSPRPETIEPPSSALLSSSVSKDLSQTMHTPAILRVPPTPTYLPAFDRSGYTHRPPQSAHLLGSASAPQMSIPRLNVPPHPGRNGGRVSLMGIPKGWVVEQLNKRAGEYWHNPSSSDIRVLIPIPRSKIPQQPSRPPTYVASTPSTQPSSGAQSVQSGRSFWRDPANPQAGVGMSNGEDSVMGQVDRDRASVGHSAQNKRRGSNPSDEEVVVLCFPLHQDYLLTQSHLFRALLASTSPRFNPSVPLNASSSSTPPRTVRGARVLPTLPGDALAIYLPLPDPSSFSVIVHWLYWGNVEALESALSKGIVEWQGVVKNIHYLGLDDYVKRILGRWWRRWVKTDEGRSATLNSNKKGGRKNANGNGWDSDNDDDDDDGANDDNGEEVLDGEEGRKARYKREGSELSDSGIHNKEGEDDGGVSGLLKAL